MPDPTFDLRLQDVAPALLEAQREVNAVLAKMPHPGRADPRRARSPACRHRPQPRPDRSEPDRTPRRRTRRPPAAARVHAARATRGPLPHPRRRLGRRSTGDDDLVNDRLARATGTIVVSPEYRLAPEATIPEQIEETVAVARWLARHATAEFGTGRLLIGGISAGAHLAAATLLALRDAGDPAFGAFAGAYLDCGIYDLGLSPSAAAATEDSLVLTRSWIDGLPDLALPGHTPEQRRAPQLSPAPADLTGFPPALLTVGDLDPLRDDAILLAARLRLAGRVARLEIWPEAPHAFTDLATPLGDVALDSAIAWLNDLLEPGRTAPGPAAVVHRFVTEVVNGGDLDVVGELWHDDLAWHAGSAGDLHGIEAYQAALRAAIGGRLHRHAPDRAGHPRRR
ncbi:alpha/beta hydrolase fold domain-containing protein [Amycolatopsis sp. NPDC049253]|uniref:alpha/beta hydrolase fold domain-containing protein n=1 Tax=Amycolatopsis sp. NPDC049253 TaxID=3155274 RepID=UPI0034364BAB